MATEKKVTMPIQPELRGTMNKLAELLNAVLPECVCFAFFVSGVVAGGFINCISNAEREEDVS